MGENVNREICLTIQANRQDPQSNFTAHGYGWREEMITKINKAIVSDTPTSKLRSSEENLKISIPPDAFLKAYEKSYCPEKLTIGPLYANLRIDSRFDDCKAVCVKQFMERHGKSDVEDLIKHLIPDPNDLNNHYSNLSQDNIKDFQLLVTIDTVFIHEFLLFLSIPKPRESVCSYFDIFYFNSDFTLYLRLERDLLLMGNQIPMSFLKKIALDIANNPDFSLDVLEETMRKFIVRSNPFFSTKDVKSRFLRFLESKNIKSIDTCKHLLDSLYFSCTFEEEFVAFSMLLASRPTESTRQSNSEES